jgi:hypothetical protein
MKESLRDLVSLRDIHKQRGGGPAEIRLLLASRAVKSGGMLDLRTTQTRTYARARARAHTHTHTQHTHIK